MASYSTIITSAEVIIEGGQIFNIAASCFVNVSEEEINLWKKMPFQGIHNTPQSSEWHSSKVRCENGAKCNWETIYKFPWKFCSTCMNKSMVSQQILSTVMTCVVVDKNTNHTKPHSICFIPQYCNYIKDNERNLCFKICWQLKTPTPTWTHAALCKWATSTRHVSCQKLLQTRSTCRSNKKTLFGKRVMKRIHCR